MNEKTLAALSTSTTLACRNGKTRPNVDITLATRHGSLEEFFNTASAIVQRVEGLTGGDFSDNDQQILPEDYNKLKKKIGHSYKLELLDWMKIHPIFHIDRLRKAARDPLPSQSEEPPEPQTIFDQKEWEVSDILASCLHYRKLQYKVKWVSWDDDQK